MKWEELIAEAREAGVLAFYSEGIAVLRAKPDPNPINPEPDEQRSAGIPPVEP